MKNRFTTLLAHSRVSLVRRIILAGVIPLTLALIAWWSFPPMPSNLQFSNATYQVEGGEPVEFSMPFYVPGEGRRFTVRLDMYYPESYPSEVRIVPDDCLERLLVNGKTVDTVALPICPEFAVGEVFELAQYLVPGKNTVEAVLTDRAGNVSIDILPERPRHGWHLALRILLYASAFLLVALAPLGGKQKNRR